MAMEISNGHTEKFIYHPILDDSDRMMKIIANPLYDKLTLSRAAYMQNHNGSECLRKKVRIQRPNEKILVTPLQKPESDETTITSLSMINNQQETITKFPVKRSLIPPITLPRRSSINRISQKTRKSSAHSRTSSIHSSFTDNDKKPIADGTIRYVNTRHGFEVQRYSSSNWLSIDLLTKDACEAEEKTFREMLDKKEQVETLSKSIYTSEYYRQRWEDLLQSYKDGLLTHDEWAKQNYRLYCLKTFYIQACEREQDQLNSYERDIRHRQAQCVFNQWKEGKTEGNSERQTNQSHSSTSHRITEVTSVLSNPSSSFPNDTINNHMSSTTNIENEFEHLPVYRFMPRKRSVAPVIETSYMLDEKRWSLNAMLKRVVGLDQPLPPPPKIIHRRFSSLTRLSNDSGFESGH